MRAALVAALAAVLVALAPVRAGAQAPDLFESVAPTKPSPSQPPKPTVKPEPSAPTLSGAALLEQAIAVDILGDEKRAFALYLQAAATGHNKAMTALGKFYDDHSDATWISNGGYHTAMKWFQKAQASGDPDATCQIGFLYDYGHGVDKNESYAQSLYLKAATGGSTLAMRIIGNDYTSDYGFHRKNYSEAKKWYERAAAAGDYMAMIYLAGLYFSGRGVPMSVKDANDWIQRAIDAGGTHVYEILAIFFASGNELPKDCARAVRMLRLAVERESIYAIFHLGELYRDGECVNKDLIEARRLFVQAASVGSEHAKKALREMK